MQRVCHSTTRQVPSQVPKGHKRVEGAMYLGLNLVTVSILNLQSAAQVMQSVGSQAQHLAQELLNNVPAGLVCV